MKSLDLSQPLKLFTGEPIQNGQEDLTLKDVLLTYLMSVHQMGMSQDDQATLYGVGFIIGPTQGAVELEQKQYDALKRMVDRGAIRTQAGDQAIYAIVVSQQAKDMVDAAQTV